MDALAELRVHANVDLSQGIRVELELDMPGHAAAWCVGYPELCPLDKGPNSPGCGAPLDVSKNSTFELVDGLVGELHEMFPVSNTDTCKDLTDWVAIHTHAACVTGVVVPFRRR